MSEIDDNDIPAVLGGTHESEPPSRDRIAEARARVQVPGLEVGKEYIEELKRRAAFTTTERSVLREAVVATRTERPAAYLMEDTPAVRKALRIDFGQDRDI